MTIQRMVELLEIEHECMLRGSHDDCDRDCANCELVQDDMELHEMYTSVISMLKEQESIIETLKSDLQETLDVVANQWNVVRCKECKFWYKDECSHLCKITGDLHPANWFCADGEQKDDNH